MARNSLLCADVPLRNYSLTHTVTVCVFLLLLLAISFLDNFPFVKCYLLYDYWLITVRGQIHIKERLITSLSYVHQAFKNGSAQH